MRYWLMKSEPDVFSIDDLARVRTEPWSGVRNYQARNFMRDDMRIGDGVLFYHSRASRRTVASEENLRVAGAQEPECTRQYMRIPSTAGTQIIERSRFFEMSASCAQPGVVGLGEVASEAYPDPTQFDPASAYFDAASKREQPRWMLVDVRFTRKLTRIIALGELRQQAALDDFALLRRGNRLSILPVTKAQWNYILSLE